MKKLDILVFISLLAWMAACFYYIYLGKTENVWAAASLIFLPPAVSFVSAGSAVVFHHNKPMFLAGKITIGWMAGVILLFVFTILNLIRMKIWP